MATSLLSSEAGSNGEASAAVAEQAEGALTAALDVAWWHMGWLGSLRGEGVFLVLVWFKHVGIVGLLNCLMCETKINKQNESRKLEQRLDSFWSVLVDVFGRNLGVLV